MKTCPVCLETFSDDKTFCLKDGTRLESPIAVADAQLAAGLSRHFRIIRRLGKGGMGTVFLAEQIGVGNRLVALKVLNRRFLDDPDFLMRFKNEAGSTGRIHHLNIVTIHESEQGDDGTPYIAMEYLEGESLRELLQRSGALPVSQVAQILLQTSRGLNAAHKLGIIHRDLKPDNIFLTKGDEGETIVKVVDFGIAKLRESTTHTQTGIVMGTPAYMSSEQANGVRSSDLDVRSDVYSLGIMVYEMLTGHLPFYAQSPTEFLRMHIYDLPPPFGTIAPELDLSPQLEAVVMKALSKKREDRYSSALEFAHAFVSAAPTETEFNPAHPLRSTVVVGTGTEVDFDSPVRRSEPSRPRLDVPVQPPPLPPLARNAQVPHRQTQGITSARDTQLAQNELPKPQPVPLFSNKLILIAIGAVALILVGTGVAYLSTTRKTADGQPENVNPPPPVADDNPIVGCYQWFNGGGVAIRADHTVQGGPFMGNWESLNPSARTYLITWGQGVTSYVKIADDQLSLAGGNQYGGKDAATRVAGSSGLVGTWNWLDVISSTVTVNPDGTWRAVAPNAQWGGTWQAGAGSSGTYTMTSSDLLKDRLTLSSDGSRLSGADQLGIAISGTKTGPCP
jgi:eukaryotic-like serine/threonine-protein kinase